jgi:hypothetical protein
MDHNDNDNDAFLFNRVYANLELLGAQEQIVTPDMLDSLAGWREPRLGSGSSPHFSNQTRLT